MRERLLKIVSHKVFIPVTVGIVSFGTGVGAGIVYSRRKNNFGIHELPEQLTLDYQKPEEVVVEERIWEPPNQEEPETPLPEHFTPAYLRQKAIEEGQTFIEEKVLEPKSDDVEEPLVTHSVFAEVEDDWDYEKELATRTREAPYILHKDEFYADEMGFTQNTLTYYAGDDIMVDEDDAPIYNYETIVGELKFGHGSGDPNVVHVRNEKRHAEYEILRDPGLYSVEVLGIEIEDNQRVQDIKHSANRKFRME